MKRVSMGMLRQTQRFCYLALGALCLIAKGRPTLAQVPGVEHVVVIGIDGLSPDGIIKTKSTVMHQMMKEGAFSLHARGVIPTVSSPNWASMIMGAGPEQHGVTSNEWSLEKHEIEPIVKGPGGMFPTIFGVMRQAKPNAKIAVIHDWDGFGRLFERKMVNTIDHPKGHTATIDKAIERITTDRPAFTFIHLDHVDHAGHQHGHGTKEYYESVEEADRLIGKIREALGKAGIADKTLVLITADHGGKGKGHGGSTMREIEIPWILTGPSVRSGHEIQTPINTYDTAATVAYVFGVKPPSCWVGKPINEAFSSR